MLSKNMSRKSYDDGSQSQNYEVNF